MLTKRGPPAVWIRYIILVSLPLKCCSLIFGVAPDYEENDEFDDVSKLNQHIARTPLVAGRNSSDVEMSTVSSNAERQNEEPVVEVRRTSILPSLNATNMTDTKAVFVSSWKRGSTSLDRISRVLFPFVFLITILVFLGQRNV
jgi:hypothetical protein